MKLSLKDLKQFEGMPFEVSDDWIEVSIVPPWRIDVCTLPCQGGCNAHPVLYDEVVADRIEFSLVDLHRWRFRLCDAPRPMIVELWIGKCNKCVRVHWMAGQSYSL